MIVLTVVLALASPCAAQFLAQESCPRSGLVEKVHGAEIDWGGEFYFATGEGIVPSTDEEPNRTKAYLKAGGYGRMKAIANLLMAIDGTAISYKTSGKDYIARDETLQQTIQGYVSNAEVVGEKRETEGGDTIVVVTVRTPMYGAKGVGSAILKSSLQRGAKLESRHSGLSVEKRGDSAAPTTPPEASGPFTSLIVDCSGLDIERAMNPRVRRPDGSEVWGALTVDYDFLQDHGIVAYARNMDEARRSSRARSNPLVTRAIGRAGGAFMCDPIISSADSDRILKENAVSHFLDKFDVVFVVDNTR